MNRLSTYLCILLFLIVLVLCITPPASAGGTRILSSYSMRVGAGWNLVSVPVSVSNGRKDFLFPSAASAAYVFYNATGYQARDTLQNGMGFWLKFNSPDTVLIEGDLTYGDTIPVQAGWNIIGPLSVSTAVSAVQTDPPGIITSQFFGYVPGAGYRQATILQPGYGYWVNVSQNGSIMLSANGLPCVGTPTVSYAGKTYNTVQIGSQCWLRENLDVGTMINGAANQTNNSLIEQYCYDNNPANCTSYGGLYQWREAMQYTTTPGAQGICPPGWHIPTLVEYRTLSTTVGGNGNVLKEIGQGVGSGAGTNTSGFSTLLAGSRNVDGYFYYLGNLALGWSSTENNVTFAHYLELFYNDGHIDLGFDQKNSGFSVRCLKDQPNLPPNTPSTPTPDSGETNVWTSPTLRWSCSDPDGDPLTYDVYFGTVNPPATVVSSNQTDTNLTRSGLATGTTYYWKVVAKDNYSNSTSGPVWRFTTQSGGGAPCTGLATVVYQGKTYHTVQIGSQCWLRENLDVGTMIQGSQVQTNNSIIEKYCYDNNPANCTTYGGLYQWNEAMQYSTTPGIQGICPPGWHMPTLAEYQTLRTTVGGDGNALKEIGQGSGGGAGTNTSGFSALLAGYRSSSGVFGYLGNVAFVWSSTETDASYASYLNMGYDDGAIYLSINGGKNNGFVVRCLED